MAGEEPVSPMSQCFNTPAFPVSVLVVFETNVPIDYSAVATLLEKVFLPINPRFSSIMVRDEQGRWKWKKMSVIRVEDHIRTPVFAGDPTQFYDEQLQDYLSEVAMESLPHGRPLWEVHLVKYPTKGAAGSLILKLHHALGDGFSLMGALFSSAKRADDPSLPFTFPSSRVRVAMKSGSGLWGVLASVRRGLSLLLNTVEDFTRSLLSSSLMVDDRTPLRSGRVGEFMSVSISSTTILLSHVREIKCRLKATTVNDVIAGTVFYGAHLYLRRQGRRPGAGEARMTALVLASTRAFKSYQTVEDMVRPDDDAGRWGNRLGFMHVPIPRCKDAAAADPLEFVLNASKTMKKKKNSLGLCLTGKLMQAITRLRGPEAVARLLAATVGAATMVFSNMVGPVEEMLIAGHPVTGLYFMTAAAPLISLINTTVISYAGKLRVAVAAEKGFIDSDLFVACLEEAFCKIFEAAVGKKPNGVLA